MTAKELRNWTEFLHDDAIIEVSPDYSTKWSPLEYKDIRAVYQCPTPSTKE